MKLTSKNIRIFRRAQRKYNVSVGFLKANIGNIKKFLLYAVSPHIVIKHQAVRKRRFGRYKVILDYYYLRRFLFDPARRKMIKRRKKNVQQWSKSMVCHLKKTVGCQEYIEDDEELEEREAEGTSMPPGDVSKQLKEQLDLLRSGKRISTLIEGISTTPGETKCIAGDQIGKEKFLGQADQEVKTYTSDNVLNNISNERSQQQSAKALYEKVNVDKDPEIQETSVPVQNSEHTENNCNPILNNSEKTEILQSSLEKTPDKKIITEEQSNGYSGTIFLRAETKNNYENTHEMLIHHNQVLGSGETVLLADIKDSSMPTLEKAKSSNFLDMLMSKVNVRRCSLEDKIKYSCENEITPQKEQNSVQQQDADFTDSSDEFLGFEETELLPGMLLTPLVPYNSRNHSNSAFVSESLNEYMRENLLESHESKVIREYGPKRILRQANCDGLVTPTCDPPTMDMPAVPESLQRLRTVAERRQLLQKFSKNHKLSIINNEATIYRELQRKMRQQKVKSAPLQLLQASSSQMPFTRQGWKATSFVVTDYNKYFYQMLQVDGNKTESIALPGSRGNNDDKFKNPYMSRASKDYKQCCTDSCFDLLAWRDFKSIKTQANKAKLNKNPLRPVFKPCPLSQKPFQKPLDDETAALLLAGGSMAVVRMPTVELQVFPELAKPLHEVAKRYLQYILPHHDISREWAEFSVSTLQHPPQGSMMKEVEKAAAAANAADGHGRRKSFTFAIPYLNDRNHILVRRVVDRSEQLDRSFEESRDSPSAVANLSFRVNLNPLDTQQQECADVVSDMINSVAISCSENSFIKEDPHGVDARKVLGDKLDGKEDLLKVQSKKENTSTPYSGKAVAIVQPQPNKKQNRLLCELRRLNATIIDAAAKPEKESKPCSNDYCALGCICSSLADEYPMRQHCGKSKCVIDCYCKIPQNSRIMRLETDGRFITSEDAFLLRRKATARLARMEKEFTSTIVLTDNETLLINESQYDKKRRCTKAPKRYDDFTDDDDYSKTPPKKTGALMAIETSSLSASYVDERSLSNTGYSELATELREPIFIKDTILNDLKHCTVVLAPLDDMKNVAIWCMVHEMYKCFCGGRALEGKPLAIEKEDGTVTISIANSRETEHVVATSKARYSFEKDESIELNEPTASPLLNSFDVLNENSNSEGSCVNEDSLPIQFCEKDETAVSVYESEHSDNDEPTNLKKAEKRGRPIKIDKRGRPMEQTILRDYMNAKLNWCRRAVAVPKKTYTRRNRKRLAQVKEYIEANENAKTRLMLNEHILRSVYYHKNEMEKTRRVEEKKEHTATDKLLDKTKMMEKEQKQRLQKSQYRSKEDDNDDVQIINDSITAETYIVQNSCTISEKRQDRLKRRRNEMQKSQTESQAMSYTIADDYNESQETTANKKLKPSDDACINKANDYNSEKNLQIPIISSCYSLNNQGLLDTDLTQQSALEDSAPAISLISSTADVCAATEGAEHQTAADLGLTDGVVSNANFKEFYNVVIKNMNSLVSKKMQDIDMALKRESKVIPPPNEEILCIIKWSNFLDAFMEGFVFIWEVRMEQQHFFAATISNLMPMILGAVSVINIAAMHVKKLPLIGRMLVERSRNENTGKLAIVMQGRTKYWLVKGFLHPDGGKACAKPTPQSHPLLTKKINVLCSLLVKQRVKEYQRKMELQQRQTQKQETVQLHNRPVVARRIISQPSYKIVSKEAFGPSVNMHNRSSTESVSTDFNNSAPSETTLTKGVESLKFKSSEKQRSKQTQAKKLREKNNKAPSQTSVAAVSTVAVQKNFHSTNTTITTSTSSSFSSSALRSLSTSEEINSMKSNIEFRRITKEDIGEIHQPEFLPEDHRWLVLQLYNDFSHIFVPDFRDLVSLDRIHKVMAFSRQKNKIVKLQFFQNAPYDAFVTPSSNRKIYFGPLKLHMQPPLLILLQSVDGQMMLREVYQMEHHIPVDINERTTAFWMIQLNEQLHFEIEENENLLQNDSPLPHPLSNLIYLGEDSDDDCMIVDDNSHEQQTLGEEELGQLLPLTKENVCSIITKPQSNGVPVLAQPLPQAISLDSPTETIKEPATRMNFTIQTMGNNKQLQITPDYTNSNSMQFVNSNQIGDLTSTGQLLQLPMSTTQAAPGFVPLSVVITNVAPAPKEAPYSSTIYISNVSEAPAQGTKVVPTIRNGQLNSLPTLTTCVPLLTVAKTTLTNTVTAGIQSEINSINSFQKTMPATAIALPTTKATASATAIPTTTTMNKAIASKKLSAQDDVLITSPAKTGSLSIKRRRMSLRCPIVTDMETTNIAIDAAIKLLPDSYDVLSQEKQNATTSVKRKKVSSVGDKTNIGDIVSTEVSKTLYAPGSTMLLHNTTITKLKDAATIDGHKKISLLSSIHSDESLKKYSFKKSSEETKNPISEPVVFDVNFIDGTDEPAVSIVIKPTLASTLTSTTISYTAKSTSNTVTQNSLPKLPVVSSVSGTKAPIVTARANAGTLPVKSILNAPNKIYRTLNSRTAVNASSATAFASCGATTTSTSNMFLKKPLAFGLTQAQNSISKDLHTVNNLPNKVNSVIPITVSVPGPVSVPTPVRCTTKVFPAKQRTVVKSFNTQPNADRTSHVINLPQSKTVIKVQKPNDTADPLKPETKAAAQPQKSIQSVPRMSLSPSSVRTPVTFNTSQTVEAVTNVNVAQQRRSLPTVSSKTVISMSAGNVPPTLHKSSLKSVFSMTSNSRSSNLSRQDIQYGYFCASAVGLPKFVAKRIGTEFLIRVPGLDGVHKLTGIAHVNTYINKHFLKSKQSEEIVRKLSAVWRFVPQDRITQEQRKRNSSNQLSIKGPTESNTLNVSCSPRKVAPKCSTIISSTSIGAIQKPKIVFNGIADIPATNSEQNDTILIDD